MSFGELYASLYDGLYEEKPYDNEVTFILDAVRAAGRFAPQTLLDLGCGTGRHAEIFAFRGLSVEAVDRSKEMIAIANRRLRLLPPNVRHSVNFRVGDIRTLSLGRTFDVVTLLFHVMSYMTSNADVAAALSVARSHLKAGGVLVFDFWYGPAVHAHPPERRSRVVPGSRSGVVLERRTIPAWESETDTVRIRYDLVERAVDEVLVGTEEHAIRYFFKDGIAEALAKAGFELSALGEWLTGDSPSERTFSVYAVAVAR